MANLKEIRGRIGSVKNTRKITSAMSRIAAARLVKAQQAALAARPYGERLEEVVRALVTGASEGEGGALHPLLGHRTGNNRVGLILLTADRGLAGGFNANVNRAGLTFIKREQAEGREVVVITVGKKGRAFLGSVQKIERSHEAPTLANIVERTFRRGGKVIIPAFALERAQEVVYTLKHLQKTGALPRLPVYIDSPQTVKITEIRPTRPPTKR